MRMIFRFLDMKRTDPLRCLDKNNRIDVMKVSCSELAQDGIVTTQMYLRILLYRGRFGSDYSF
jgi:hypothetical protein